MTETLPDPLVAEPVIMLDPKEIDADMPGRIGLFYPVKADGLAARIEADGQLEPILVVRTGPRAKTRFRLVAGLHRLRACERLGRQVDVRIVHGSADELLRMQASENLDRRQMSVLERSMFIAAVADAAMKRVSEAHGGASQQQIAIKARWATVDKLSTVSAPARGGEDLAEADQYAEDAFRSLDAIYSWKAETAEACGLGEKDVQRALRIFRCIVEPFRDLMDQLKDRPAADNASKLLAVAGVPIGSRREALIELMADQVEEKPPVDRAQKRFNTLIDTYSRMPAVERRGAIQGLISNFSDAELSLAKMFIEEKLK